MTAPRFENEHELIAPHSGDRVAGAHRQAKPLGRLNQHRVSGGVARRVVHRFEPVQVTVENRYLCLLTGRASQRGPQTVEEQGTVREPGEAVVQRIMGELLFRLDDFGDVSQDPENLDDRAIVVAAERHDVATEPMPRAVDVAKSVAALKNLPVRQMACFFVHLHQRLAIVGMHDRCDRRGPERLCLRDRAPKQVAIARPVDEGAGLEIGYEGVVRRGRDHRLLERIGLARLGLGQDLLGDVRHGADETYELAVFEDRAPRESNQRSSPSPARKIR